MRWDGYLEGATALILPIGLLCVSGCGALGAPRPIIENRFKTELPAQPDNPSHVAVNVATGPVADNAAGISIIQLSDRGQAALVEQTKGKPPTSIKSPASESEAAVAVRNAVKRHMVVAIRTNGFLSSGDRVDAIKVRLEVPEDQPGGWSITSWTQASNGEITIDVGKSTEVNSSKLTASTGTGFISALPNANLGGELSQTSTREANIKDTTVFDAAVDGDGRAWLDETAGWRVGLSHNLSMDAVATAPLPQLRKSWLVSVTSLTRDDPAHAGKTIPQLPEQVRLNVVELDVSDADTQPICGRATLQYRIRHITNEAGRATFSEADDIVQPFEGTASTSFLFAPAPISPIYSIGLGGEYLSYIVPGNPSAAVNFTDLSAASAFRDWLLQAGPRSGTLANARIGISPPPYDDVRPLSTAERNSASIYVSNSRDLTAAAKASAGACRDVK